MSPSEELQPQLLQAQNDLGQAVKEVCATDLEKANTNQMIHIEELLAVAGDSAKKVISVRRRLRKDSAKGSGGMHTHSVADSGASTAAPSRVFTDDRQVTWTTFAVHPSRPRGDLARLPGPFQSGWLSFDSGSETRRLTPIPDGWAELPEDELRRLCAAATLAARRGTRD